MKLRTKLFAAIAAASLALTGCGGGAQAESAQDALTIDEPWAKAAPKDKGMTGVFGTVENSGKEPIQITAGQAEVADKVELHETTGDGKGGMSMKEKEGGFEVKPGDKLEFKPGGDHIMLMQLNGDIQPGDDVKITLTTSAGDFEFTAPAREFTGAKEEYAPGEEDHGEHMDHGDGMDHGDSDSEDQK